VLALEHSTSQVTCKWYTVLSRMKARSCPFLSAFISTGEKTMEHGALQEEEVPNCLSQTNGYQS
jgi:hypothetical protein